MAKLGEKEFATLNCFGKEKSVGDLVRETGIRVEQFVREKGILDNLQDLEFISKRKNPKDKRETLVKLTRNGKSFLRILNRIKCVK